MNTINIIDLIENNPNIGLSQKYNSKIINNVKENFTELQQKLFVTFYYFTINSNENDFVIDIDDVWNWIGYTQKVNAKQLIEKNFIKDIDYIISINNKKKDDKKKGGHNKEKILLKLKTFKLFCLKTNTKKADEIHRYFVKLNDLLYNSMNEECNELKLQLEKKINEMINIEKNIEKDREIDKHNFLLTEFGNIGSIIYIIKVKTLENNDYIVKIGESRKGIQGRYNDHKKNYDESIILDCFSVDKSKDFESYIHNYLKKYKVNDLINHETEKELFIINKNNSYNNLIKIIKDNIKYYNGYSNQELENIKNDIENIKLINNLDSNLPNNNLLYNNLLEKIEKIELYNNNKFDDLENSNKEILNKLNSLQTKTTNNFNEPLTNLGPRLQKFNPISLELVHVYESVSECLKENNIMKRPSISKSVQENTIYNGFRWQLIDRELDPYLIKNIEPTKETMIKNIGYLAKLNSDKSEILNVYIDRKNACKLNNYLSITSLDNAVTKCTITNGNYYILYDKCSNELKNNFEKKYGTPILYKDGIGQFDKDNNLVQEFICKNNCCKSLGISDKTLNKALEKNIMYNNFYYKHINEKLCII
jgi:hypothetical protein